MIFNKKKKDKIKKEEYKQRILQNIRQEETTKIDITNFNIEKSKSEIAYERFSSLETKDLRYKLEHELLTNDEITIIKRIIDERISKKQKK